MRYTRAHVDRQASESDGPLRIVVASEGRKADGLDLRMDRARLERWRENPVVLLEHFPISLSADMPAVIGRADEIAVDGSRLVADITFDTGSAIGAEIDRQYREGFLHAFSVGFDLGEVDRNGVPAWWEPVEVSSVPVPMDPEALVEDGRKQLAGMARAFAALERGDEPALAELRRALGTSRPQQRAAIGPHSTATVEDDWDGPGAVADAPNDEATLAHMHAWRDDDGDPEAKNTYKFPHHAAGTDTAANLPAVRNALSRLPQADIPDTDRDAVEAHLQRHLDDAEEDDDDRTASSLAIRDRRLRLLGA